MTANVIASQKTRAADTHPLIRDRIAAFERAAGGEAALAQIESHLLLHDRELLYWDEVIDRSHKAQPAA